MTEIDQVIAELWRRSRPVVAERLELLDAAARAATAHDLGPELRHDATGVAHKLAGSLSTYGVPEGSQLASAIEQELECSCDPARLSGLVAQLRDAFEATPAATDRD